MIRTLPALAGLAVTALVLTGCTSSFLAGSGPIAEPTPTPAETSTVAPQDPVPTATPEADGDCGDVLLNRAGNYVLGDCATVTVEGSGVRLTFGSIETLVVRGMRVDLTGTELGSVEIEGQNNEISVRELGALRVRGEGNTVLVDQRVASVVIDGNENVVSAGDGIGSVIDNGLLNEIG